MKSVCQWEFEEEEVGEGVIWEYWDGTSWNCLIETDHDYRVMVRPGTDTIAINRPEDDMKPVCVHLYECEEIGVRFDLHNNANSIVEVHVPVTVDGVDDYQHYVNVPPKTTAIFSGNHNGHWYVSGHIERDSDD